jgi:O-antigen/teichoic acid export membrane protein
VTGVAPAEDALATAAVRGIAVLLLRTGVMTVLTFGATIVLARELRPRDYGLFAVGFAIQQFTRAAVDTGLPIPLVRRESPPTVAELRALTGFVLLGGIGVAIVAAGIGFVVLPVAGNDSALAKVIGVTCLATPFYGLRIGSMIGLERGLRFGRLALVEATEAVGFYAFAVPAAIAGLGAFSLAGAVGVGIAASSIVGLALGPWPFGTSTEFGLLRPLARLGLAAGSLYPISLIRETGFVSILTAIGGASLTGIYAFAQRIFSVPTAMIVMLLRVGLPTLSQSEAGTVRARRAAQAAAVSAVAMGFLFSLLVGALRPLLAVVFGDRWLPSANVAVAAAPGAMLAGTVIILTSLFLADGRARPPLESILANSVVSLIAVAVLADPVGGVGVGIAASLGSAAGVLVLLLRASREAAACIFPVGRALAVAALSVAAGWLVAPGHGPSDLAVGLGVSAATWSVASLLLTRHELAMLIRLARKLPRRAA